MNPFIGGVEFIRGRCGKADIGVALRFIPNRKHIYALIGDNERVGAGIQPHIRFFSARIIPKAGLSADIFGGKAAVYFRIVSPIGIFAVRYNGAARKSRPSGIQRCRNLFVGKSYRLCRLRAGSVLKPAREPVAVPLSRRKIRKNISGRAVKRIYRLIAGHKHNARCAVDFNIINRQGIGEEVVCRESGRSRLRRIKAYQKIVSVSLIR